MEPESPPSPDLAPAPEPPAPEAEERPREERPEDYVVLLAQVPERVADLALGIDESRLAYRHAPALPTLAEVIDHLAHTGTLIDGLFRRVLIDGSTEVDLLAALEPARPPAPTGPDTAEESRSDLLDRFARDRRRTADLLRGLARERWDRPVFDARLGELTLLELCDRVGRHEAGHLVQIRNLIALLPETLDLGPIR